MNKDDQYCPVYRIVRPAKRPVLKEISNATILPPFLRFSATLKGCNGISMLNEGKKMMTQKVFIPVTDEMLYEHPELITAPLRPYQIDDPCYHWLDVEIEPVEEHRNAA